MSTAADYLRFAQMLLNGGEPDDGTHYYKHWLAALKKLVAEKISSRPTI